MKKILFVFLLSLFLFSCAPPPNVDAPIKGKVYVRILLKQFNTKVTIEGENLSMVQNNKQYPIGIDIWHLESKNNVLQIFSGKKKMGGNFSSIVFSSSTGFIKVNNKKYRGKIKIIANKDNIYVVNIVSMENYLKGVVPREIGIRPAEELAAMEAQAVAARTYAYSHLYPNRFYDMENTVNDQVYGGMSSESEITNEAVEKTKGIIITYKGKPIDAKYHSTCGGMTSSNEDEWGGDPVPYLRPVKDADKNGYFCSQSKHFHWKHKFERKYFFNFIRENIKRQKGRDPGIVKKIILKKHMKRVFEITVIAQNGKYTFKGLGIRKLFSGVNAPGDFLRSRYFSIKYTKDKVIIDGYGFGHGVGMCQYGAMGMAKRGYSYEQILKHYYKGIKLMKIE